MRAPLLLSLSFPVNVFVCYQGVKRLQSGMLVEILEQTDRADALSPNANDPCDVTYNG